MLTLVLLACGTDRARPTDELIATPSSTRVALFGDVATKGHPFFELDGLGVLAFADFAVVSENGRPRKNVRVDVTTEFDGIALIPEEAVRTVSPPSLPEGVESDADIEAACTDDQGNYSNAEAWCAWYYGTDAAFIDFGAEYAFDGYSPTYVELTTDKDGLARAYIFVDRLPSDSSGTFETFETQVLGTTGFSAATFDILAE